MKNPVACGGVLHCLSSKAKGYCSGFFIQTRQNASLSLPQVVKKSQAPLTPPQQHI